jgi:hypothetical protein
LVQQTSLKHAYSTKFAARVRKMSFIATLMVEHTSVGRLPSPLTLPDEFAHSHQVAIAHIQPMHCEI